jgi:hypothetical protein
METSTKSWRIITIIFIKKTSQHSEIKVNQNQAILFSVKENSHIRTTKYEERNSSEGNHGVCSDPSTKRNIISNQPLIDNHFPSKDSIHCTKSPESAAFLLFPFV